MSTKRIRNANNANGAIEILDDGTIRVADKTDKTKKFEFDLSALSASTTVTFPVTDTGIKADVISEKTPTNGVVIDTLKIKDGNIEATTDNGIQLKDNAGNAGITMADGGAVTLGGITGSTTHTLRSSDVFPLLIQNTTSLSTAAGFYFKAESAILGAIQANTTNNFEVWNSGIAVLNGSCSNVGAWTFGPASGGDFAHTIKSASSDKVLSILNTSSTCRINIQSTGTNKNVAINATPTGVGGLYFTVTTGTGGFVWSTASTSLAGSCSDVGSWTFGPAGYNGNHNINCSVLSFDNKTLGANESQYINLNVAYIGRTRQGGESSPCGMLYLGENDGGIAYYFTGNDGVLRATTAIATVYGTQGTIVGTQSSDERLKQNIIPCTKGLDVISALDPIEFDKEGVHKCGFSAQKTISVLPEAVYDTGEKVFGEEQPSKLAMDYTQIIAPMVKAIQELSAKLDEANAEIASLKLKVG